MTLTLSTVKPAIPRRLDLACGQQPSRGFVGVDLAGQADIVHDLLVPPWPFGESTVREVVCNHFVEHIPHWRPDFNGVDGWWIFFNELWRVCEGGALCTFVHPYAKHHRAFQDPTHTRFLVEQTWAYLDENWRVEQKLDHYDARCNFVVKSCQGLGNDQVPQRAKIDDEWRTRHWDVLPDLRVEITAVKA